MPAALYPLKFKPRFVEKMWGGRKLETILGKHLPPDQLIGESWELYDFPPGVVEGSKDWVSAEVANGPLAGRTLHSLVNEFGRDLYGDVKLVPPGGSTSLTAGGLTSPTAGGSTSLTAGGSTSLTAGGQFPILIKFLDAREDLSVQVHPDQHYAAGHPGAHLKSEAWYVFQHEPGARILKGLKPGTTRDQFKQAIADGTVERLIEAIPVKDGHCFYLPSGTIHALGAGILVAEVQTPSDTTFRVFDFNRIDPGTGKPRKLHVSEALECIDFSGNPEPQQPRSHVAGYFTTVSRLVTSPYFKLEKVRMTEGVEEPVPYDQPVVWMMLAGEAQVKVDGLTEPVRFARGDTVLLPAKMKNPIIKTTSDCQWLEVTFPVET